MCPRHPSDCYFHAICPQVVVCLLFQQAKCNVLLALSKPGPLTFKTPGFKTYCLQELTKFGPSSFPSQLLWEFISPIHASCGLVCLLSSLCLWLPSYKSGHNPFFFPPNWISAPPTFFDVTSSTFLVMKFVPLVIGSVSGGI